MGGRFTANTVGQIGIQLLKLLEDLHSIGYVHNDLKPDNILVGKHGERGDLSHIKLIDFGMAKKYKVKPENRKTEKLKAFGYDEAGGNLAFASPNSMMNLTVSR